MIEDKDIDIFLKAKKEEVATNVLQACSVICLTVLITLEALSVSHEYTIVLATLSVIFIFSSLGHSRWVSVSRVELIKTLEKVFNNDAKALQILARKKGVSGARAGTK